MVSDLEISPGVILGERKLGVLSPFVRSKYHHWSLLSNLSSQGLCAWVYKRRAQGTGQSAKVKCGKAKDWNHGHRQSLTKPKVLLSIPWLGFGKTLLNTIPQSPQQSGYLNPGISFLTLCTVFPKANIVEPVILPCWAVGGSRLRTLGIEPGLGNTARRRRGLSGEGWGQARRLSNRCYKVERRGRDRAVQMETHRKWGSVPQQSVKEAGKWAKSGKSYTLSAAGQGPQHGDSFRPSLICPCISFCLSEGRL